MFSSTGRHARAAGRLGFGVVMTAGAVVFVTRLVRVPDPEAAKTLTVVWLAALFVGWVAAQLAATFAWSPARRIDVVSWVLPTVGVALLLPLTLHLPFALVLGGVSHAFDDWARGSTVITGPAHLVFAYLAARRVAQLATGRPAISTSRIYVITVTVSAVPFAVLFFLPPLLVGLTGLAMLPLLERMPGLIEREQPDLPRAIVVA